MIFCILIDRNLAYSPSKRLYPATDGNRYRSPQPKLSGAWENPIEDGQEEL